MTDYSLKVEIDETARITYTQNKGPFNWEVTRVFEETFNNPEYKGADISLVYENNQITYTIRNIPLGHEGPILPAFADIDNKIRVGSLEQKVLNNNDIRP